MGAASTEANERSNLPANRDNPESGYQAIPSSGIIGYPYSGADIKLVVHMPDDSGGDLTVEELEEELSGLQERLDQLPNQGTIDLEEQLDFLPGEGPGSARSTREAELREDLGAARLEQTLYNEDDEEYATLQTQIDTLNEQIEEVVGQGNAAQADSNLRADLEEQIRAATEALEQARESSDGRIVNAQTKVLAEVQTLSYSIHREKGPVRPLGTVYPKSYTRGPRTISGSMIFTAFHHHIFQEFLEHAQYRSTGVGDYDRFRWTSYLTDQLPPLDISIVFANEYGNISWMGIFGVEFMNEGMTMSIEDLFLEGVAQYVARDIDLMRSVGNRPLRRNGGVGAALTGSNLLMQDLRQRVQGRRNPFL